MSQNIEVKVPDIGGFEDVPVIEIAVKVGDSVNAEDSLITLESDKATMDVPAPAAGVVKEIKVKVGDKVSEGSLIVILEATAGAAASAPAVAPAPAPAAAAPAPAAQATPAAAPAAPAAKSGGVVEVKVPDIGGFSDVPVIDIAVKVGDSVNAEDSLITLESDKATMDVPSPSAGVVKEIKVKVGDKVSEGTLIVLLDAAGTAPSVQQVESRGEAASAAPAAAAAAPAPAVKSVAVAASSVAPPKDAESTAAPAVMHMPTPGEMAAQVLGGNKAHASPSVRSFARELGAEVGRIVGTGPKGRITREDVVRFIKGIVSGVGAAPAAAPAAGVSGGITGGGTLDLLPWPKVDFAKFGAVEVKPLSRIKKISGANLARNWIMIPHVTQFDEADITDLEAFRVQTNKENEKGGGAKLTMLAFLIKACVAALKKYPEFNASLDGDNLVLKQYFHIGFAADTPNGLVVPVIRDCDKKGLLQIAQEMGDLAKKARDGKLGPADMTGGCFSISSLGGIGGTAFTPIINAPEVAILGVSKTQVKPVWDGKQFVPKQMLPLSLSYDHRVIDGAAAARFTSYLSSLLVDFRRVFL